MNNFYSFLIIASGGALGALCRHITITLFFMPALGSFPFGTLVVNIVGSFLTGILWHLAETFSFQSHIKLLIFTGILSAFTTFSTFALENFYLFKIGKIKLALLYIGTSNILGIIFLGMGIFIANRLSY